MVAVLDCTVGQKVAVLVRMVGQKVVAQKHRREEALQQAGVEDMQDIQDYMMAVEDSLLQHLQTSYWDLEIRVNVSNTAKASRTEPKLKAC